MDDEIRHEAPRQPALGRTGRLSRLGGVLVERVQVSVSVFPRETIGREDMDL